MICRQYSFYDPLHQHTALSKKEKASLSLAKNIRKKTIRHHNPLIKNINLFPLLHPLRFFLPKIAESRCSNMRHGIFLIRTRLIYNKRIVHTHACIFSFIRFFTFPHKLKSRTFIGALCRKKNFICCNYNFLGSLG